MDTHFARRWMTGLLLLLTSGSIMATPISYDEAVDGDLNSSKLLSLDIGDNTVTGSTQWLGTVVDHDGFKIVLPAGTSLVSVEYSFDNVVLGTGTVSLGSGYNLVDNVTNNVISQASINVVTGTSPAALFSADLPVLPDTYRVTHGLFRNGGAEGGSWDYTLVLTVADAQAVPAPFTLGLLLTGLAAGGLLRRRNG